MRIGGVSDYSSILANYKVPEFPSVDLGEAKKAERSADLQTKQTANDMVPPGSGLEIEEVQPKRRAADVKELSLTFHAEEDFGYLGKDSDIRDLDMQKAISDMRKDQVLQQYQYFVGTADEAARGNTGADGLVFIKY